MSAVRQQGALATPTHARFSELAQGSELEVAARASKDERIARSRRAYEKDVIIERTGTLARTLHAVEISG